MRHLFVHEFEDEPPLGDFDLELDPPAGAKIRFDLDGADIWVAANRAGWLHLARICAEMGMHTGFTPGYHFHRSRDWHASAAPGHEVSLGLLDDEDNDASPSSC